MSKKISELPAASSVADTDEVALRQGTVTRRASVAQWCRRLYDENGDSVALGSGGHFALAASAELRTDSGTDPIILDTDPPSGPTIALREGGVDYFALWEAVVFSKGLLPWNDSSYSLGSGAFGWVSTFYAPFTVATAPTPTAGRAGYCSNGAAGNPILAFADGTDWLRSDNGAPISAS